LKWLGGAAGSLAQNVSVGTPNASVGLPTLRFPNEPIRDKYLSIPETNWTCVRIRRALQTIDKDSVHGGKPNNTHF